MNEKSILVGNNSNPTSPDAVSQVDTLTINWHVTEACNYRCRYCYAHWKDYPDPRELFHDRDRTVDLLWKLFQFFRPENTDNPLLNRLSWKNLRLNLAGGEPSLLRSRLPDIAETAKRIGFQLSIISNGSYLSRDVLEILAPHLTCLGISLDSANADTNHEIGRADRKGKLLDVDELVANLDWARQINPELTVKLNTVVNSLNEAEDLSDLVERVRPDRWKILRMLPVINQSLAINGEQFLAFVNRHRFSRSIQCVEDHQDMCESYLMVDPYGRFFQNQPGLAGGYVYSKPLLSVGVESAFSEMGFNSGSYRSRYRIEMVEDGQ